MNTQKQINNYIARQRQWIKEWAITPGDQILVLKHHKCMSKGWEAYWNYCRMHILTIQAFRYYSPITARGIQLSDEFNYPYTVLLKVPKGEYTRERFLFSSHTNKIKNEVCTKTCVAHTSLHATKIGQFGFLKDIGALIKIVDENDPITMVADYIHSCKGYFPMPIGSYIGPANLVVASELTGIGLPIIRY